MQLTSIAAHLLRAILIASILSTLLPFSPTLAPRPAAALDDPPPTPFVSPLPAPDQPTEPLTPTLPITAPLGNGVPLGSGVPMYVSSTLTMTSPVTLTPAARLWVTAEPAGVAPGQIVTFSLAVSNTGQTPLSGLALSATLPGGLHWLPDQPGWSYDPPAGRLSAEIGALEAGTGLTLSLCLRASGPLDDLAELQVEVISQTVSTSRTAAPAPGGDVLAEGRAGVWVAHPTRALIEPGGGLFQSGDGRVQVEFPAGAVLTATQVTYQRFPASRAARVAAPAAGRQGRSDRVHFKLDAGPVFSPTTPITLSVNVSGLLDLESGRPYLAYATDERPDEWIEVHPIVVDAERGTISAQVNHFSDWQAGVSGNVPGVWSFVYTPPAVSLFSGAATHQIPLQTPAGRNGLQPDLRLSYSSRGLDGRTAATMGRTDVGPIADGWSLDVMSISRERWDSCWWDNGATEGACFKDVFGLMLNGTGYDLYGSSGQQYGRYYAEGAPWLYIERRNTLGGNASSSNETGEYWIVRLPDGQVVRLGYLSNSEQVVRTVCDGTCKTYNGNAYTQGYGGHTAGKAVRRWQADKVTTPYSKNQMTFEYQELAGEGSDKYSTLQTIYYNNVSTTTTPEWRSKVVMVIAGSSPPRMDQIEMWDMIKVGSSTSWVQVREYVLSRLQMSYSQNANNCDGISTVYYNVLSSVQEKGLSAGGGLPAQTFSYELKNSGSDGCFPLPRMIGSSNGYGGSTAITYARVTTDPNQNAAYNYRVSQVSTSGGTSGGDPAMVSQYTYAGACYNRPTYPGCVSRLTRGDSDNGPLVGHITVTQKSLSNGTEVVRQVHIFHTGEAWRKGMEKQAQTQTSEGDVLTQVNKVWSPMSLGGVATFPYLEWAISRDYSGDVTVARRTDYTYDGFGNVTKEIDYGTVRPSDGSNVSPYTGDERTTFRVYAIQQAAGWIVNKLARETVHSGVQSSDNLNSTTTLSRVRYRYDNQCYAFAPTKGSLTAVDAWNGGTPSSDCDDSAFYTSKYAYNSTWGVQTVVTDALNHVTTTTYDANCRYPIQMTNAKSHVTSMTYYGVGYAADNGLPGQVRTITDPNAATTTYYYDIYGRLAKLFRPGDDASYPSMIYTYTDGAPLKIETQQREQSNTSNVLTRLEFYDGLGRPIQTRAEAESDYQAVANTTYDALGRAKRQYTPELATSATVFSRPSGWGTNGYTETSYDELGRVTQVRAPDGTLTKSSYKNWAKGLQTAVLDARNHQRISEADVDGKIVKVKEYLNTYSSPNWTVTADATTSYSYDLLGRLLNVTDAATPPNQTALEYDKLGRKTKMTDPDMGRWYYQYDAVGNLKRQTDAKNQRICFYYDELDRLKGKTYSTGTSSCPSDPGYNSYALKYYYDYTSGHGAGVGRRTSMATADGADTTNWVYDTLGRVTKETKAIGGAGGGTFATEWVYDAMDRVTDMKYPKDTIGGVGEVVKYNYTPQGLVNKVWTVDGSGNQYVYVNSASYDALGRVDKRVLGSNVQTTDYIYYGWTTSNGQGRLQWIKTGPTSPYEGVQKMEYSYDAVGNVLNIKDYKVLGGTQTQVFTYDGLDRLVSASASGGSTDQGQYGSIQDPIIYTYNAIGNFKYDVWTYGATPVGTCTSGTPSTKPHALAGTGGRTMSYDCNGNMTQRQVTGGDKYDFYYTTENWLSQVKKNDNTYATFAYNADGQRIKGTVNGATTVYIGDHFEWIGASSTMIKYYYAGGQRVAMRKKVGTSSNDVYYLLGDHLGSTALTLKAGASDKTLLRYNPYGSTRYTENTTPTTYRFTGQRQEESIGLYYYRARWYDPAIGRFIQPDTIIPDPGNPQSLNRYSYTLNNPLKYTDPTGHCAAQDQACKDYLQSLQDKFGVVIDDSDGLWSIEALGKVGQGMGLLADALEGGFERFKEIFGGVTFDRIDEPMKNGAPADAIEGHTIRFFNSKFSGKDKELWLQGAVAVTIHELGHIWDWRSDGALSRDMMAVTGAKEMHLWGIGFLPIVGYKFGDMGEPTTTQSADNRYEDWATALAASLYPHPDDKDVAAAQRSGSSCPQVFYGPLDATRMDYVRSKFLR